MVIKMLNSSVAVRFVKYLWLAFKESTFFAILLGITDYIANAYKHSILRKIILGTGNLENYTRDSVFFKIISKILYFFTTAAMGISSFFVNASKNSLCVKCISFACRGSAVFNLYTLFPFAIMCMFLVPHEMWNNMYALVIALLLCVVYFMCKANGINVGTNARAIPFQLILFFISLGVSVIVSPDKGDSLRIFVLFITSYILCFLVYGFIHSENVLISFSRMIYFTLIAASIIGVAQSIMGVETNASFTDLKLNSDMPGRVYGTMGNPNNYAEYIMLFLPFSFAYAMTRDNKKIKAICLLGLIFPLAALLTTYSRSSWIGLALACVVYVVLFNYKLIPYFITGAICALPFIPQSVYNRILTIGNTADSSSAYRITIWTGVSDMMEKFWFTGVGLGPSAFEKQFVNYAIGDTIVARHSHMQFLEMLVEGGILCFIAYVWLLVSLIKRTSVCAVRSKDSTAKHFACAGAAALTAITVIGLFEYCWFYPRVMFAFFIAVGLCLGVIRVYSKQK